MRQKFPRAVSVRAAMVVLLTLLSPDLLAYLDPSTGSMVVTALVGLFASIALAAKTYWYKFKRLFRRGRRKAPPRAENSPTEE
jgi:peptidoglycan/LPS O-acetylase OafA/YrhL